MGSDHAQSKELPTIELNEKNMTPGTISWKSTSDSVRQALESHGCLVIQYENGTSLELHEAMFGLSEQLFDLPPETKNKHTSQYAGFGHGGNFPVMPFFEYFGIEDDATLQAKINFTTLMWPMGHHKFCETLDSYVNLLMDLEKSVMKMVANSYGLDKYVTTPLTESSLYMTRLMKYHAARVEEGSIGIIPHRDKSFMAVIGTNDVQGLQIETRDGVWIDFEPSPNKFIVIVGEAFTAWSNGRIYCPLHQVMIGKSIKEKYSIGIFSFLDGVVEVPEELVDDEFPLKFKPFNNFDFLNYCKDGGPKMKGAIHQYCGL